MGLDVHAIQVVAADEATVLLRLAGHTDGPGGAPALRIPTEDREHRFTALPDPQRSTGNGAGHGAWRGAFAVPRAVLEHGEGHLILELGDQRRELPRVYPGPEARVMLGPLGRVPTAPPRTPPRPATDAQVLIVDDDELVRLAVAATLEHEGISVAQAADGAEAIERLGEAIPDLIVSDVMMPDMDGLTLVATVRANPATERVPLIFLTSKRTPGDVVAGLELGADDYLSKPFRPEELAARVKAKLQRRPVPADQLRFDPRTGVLTAQNFRDELRREAERARRGGTTGVLALLELDELPAVRERLGERAESSIAQGLAALVSDPEHPLDVVGRLDRGRFGLLLPETTDRAGEQRLDDLGRTIVRTALTAEGEHLHFTPTIGFVPFGGGEDPEQLEREAAAALAHAASHLDIRSARFAPDMLAAAEAEARRRRGAALRARLGTPAQIAATQLLGLVLPFFVYWGLDAAGLDITWPLYLIVVAALLMTALTIWLEGFLALRRPAPPDEPGAPYPTATAIIAAYLPNEAATIHDTIDAFLAQDYPAGLQVMLAYNTPVAMPIEDELHAIAARDPRFVPFKVEHSTSKAQNVNAALAHAEGEFIGVFDADHQPAPGAFERAWRWLSNGYDVVQGHCVVRNGDVSWVARTIAVEFESIYAVSHPGRAKLHDFGIFGGTNGFWRTPMLREIRMRGSMLTEDIDSSMRVVEEGGRIASDPDLISRELGPATLKALWNQRMRWAQGWFQVSMSHLRHGLRSPKLSLRQKLGLFYLLGWREIYPWLSLQMFPIVAYWILRGDDVDWVVPLFVATTIFTLGTGPAQTYFAYRLAAPDIRANRRWFGWYVVIASLFFTEFKNLIARVAQLKELVGERQWKVTPRV